jgi:hypothetical protein
MLGTWVSSTHCLLFLGVGNRRRLAGQCRRAWSVSLCLQIGSNLRHHCLSLDTLLPNPKPAFQMSFCQGLRPGVVQPGGLLETVCLPGQGFSHNMPMCPNPGRYLYTAEMVITGAPSGDARLHQGTAEYDLPVDGGHMVMINDSRQPMSVTWNGDTPLVIPEHAWFAFFSDCVPIE